MPLAKRHAHRARTWPPTLLLPPPRPPPRPPPPSAPGCAASGLQVCASAAGGHVTTAPDCQATTTLSCRHRRSSLWPFPQPLPAGPPSPPYSVPYFTHCCLTHNNSVLHPILSLLYPLLSTHPRRPPLVPAHQSRCGAPPNAPLPPALQPPGRPAHVRPAPAGGRAASGRAAGRREGARGTAGRS